MRKTTKRKETEGSIYDLARTYQARNHTAYQSLLTAANISRDMKKRLTTKKENWRDKKNPQFQEAEIELSESLLGRIDKQIEEQKNICQSVDEEVKKAQEALQAAMEKFNEQKQKEEDLKKEKKQIESIIAQKKEKLQKMQQLVLVHPTASISAIDKKRENMLVFTRFDLDNMVFSKVVDSVFKYNGEDLLKKEEVEPVREEFETRDEFFSAVAYVEMVVYYYSEGYNYELLYNSKGIKHMLELVGII